MKTKITWKTSDIVWHGAVREASVTLPGEKGPRAPRAQSVVLARDGFFDANDKPLTAVATAILWTDELEIVTSGYCPTARREEFIATRQTTPQDIWNARANAD